jgi:hypothetical protein
MPKYVNRTVAKGTIDSDGSCYDVEVSVDSLGYATIELGASMTLRLDYASLESLETFLRDARLNLEEQAIDQAGEQVGLFNDQPS